MMNYKVFSFKASFQGMGKRVLKGAALTYASLFGLSTAYQVISHFQIKNYPGHQDNPKAKKVLVISSDETNPWDKLGMALFQPILGFPGFDAPTIHQRFLEWPLRRNLAKLGYSIDWLSHPNRQQILNLNERSQNYQGVILIGHGAMGYFANSETRIEHEKDFVMRLTCNQERKYESQTPKGQRPDALDQFMAEKEQIEKEAKENLLNASDTLKTDPSFIQGLDQKGLNAKKIFTYKGLVTPTTLLKDALFGWNLINADSGHEKSFEEELQNIENEISYHQKKEIAQIQFYLNKKLIPQQTVIDLELKNIYPLMDQAKKLKQKTQNTPYQKQVNTLIEKLEARKKETFNIPIRDITAFCSEFLGQPELLEKILKDTPAFKAKIIDQFYKEWPALSKLPDSKKREYLSDIQMVFKRHQILNINF